MDMAVSIAYARRLTDAFNVGLTAKYVHQQIWNETANGFAFDVGTQYRLPFKNFVIAMTMSNFGPDMKMAGPDLNVKYDADDYLPNRLVPTNLETESYPLPLNFDFGVSMDVFNSRYLDVRAGVDAVHPNDNDEQIRVGSEISVFDRLYLRGGYRYNSDDEMFNCGVGINVFVAGTLIHADYAFSSYDLLPNVNRVSVGIEF
jgi:long-subunit fatty acid transport protein